MKKTRILFGGVDIGDRIRTYSAYVKQQYGEKVEVRSFVKFKVPAEHYKTKYDYSFQFHRYPKIIQWAISFIFFIHALVRYDVIYILSGENILTRKLLKFELACYKWLGKKVVMHFVGGDIRNSDYLYWKDKFLVGESNDKQPEVQQPFQTRLCRLAEKYADNVVVCSPDLLRFINRPDVLFIPVFLDVDAFQKELGESKFDATSGTVKVLHAPSNPGVKGAAYIERVLKKIEREEQNVAVIVTTDPEYSNSVLPPYTVTRYKLMELFQQSDILIDQLLIGWYGLQSIEALVAGNMVICQVDPSLEKYMFPDCPIITVNEPKQLEATLKKAIAERALSEEDKSRQLSWVQKYHTIDQNDTIKQLFKSLVSNG